MQKGGDAIAYNLYLPYHKPLTNETVTKTVSYIITR